MQMIGHYYVLVNLYFRKLFPKVMHGFTYNLSRFSFFGIGASFIAGGYARVSFYDREIGDMRIFCEGNMVDAGTMIVVTMAPAFEIMGEIQCFGLC